MKKSDKKAREEVGPNLASEQSLWSHVENSECGHQSKGISLKGIQQGSDIVRFAFLEDHSGCSLEDVLKSERVHVGIHGSGRGKKRW